MGGTLPAAAILAGGRARRLGGTPKHTLIVGGLRIVDRQLAVLRHVADPIFVVAPDPEPYRGLGLEIVPDIVPGRGALGGIYTAIVKSPRDRTLVIACDMPYLSRPLLQRLSGPTEADVVIPRSRRGYEPLCATYSKACAAPILRRLEAGELHAAIVPEGVVVEEIGPEALAAYDPDDLLFVNVNTPHDYEHAQSLWESMRGPLEDRITDKHSPS
jgi:molybdenum cofactor guanylyltransferase